MKKRGRKPTGLRRPVRIVVALSAEERRAADRLAFERGLTGAGILARVLLLEQIELQRRREEYQQRFPDEAV